MSEKDLKRVRDVMTTELQTVDGLATLDAAMQQMKRHGVGSLVVARRNQDDEVGLLDLADIGAVLAQNQPIDRVHVYEAMTKPVVTLPPSMHLHYAVRLLGSLGLTRAIVVDDARDAIGMVTLRDLVLADV